jgi:hypothetical protein
MIERIRNGTLTLIAAVVLAFGANEAVAGTGSGQRGCTEGNWCDVNHGGQENCNDCCVESGLGFCNSFEPSEELQGCFCF